MTAADRAPVSTPQEAVVSKALLRAADRLGVSGAELSAIVGVSPATLSRLKKQGRTLPEGDKAFELAVHFIRLFRSLDSVFGGDEAVARAWLRHHNTALGSAPIDAIKTVQGLLNAVAYLDSRRAVV
jgi:uncharacterized protein (DUF2384 family)